MSKLLAILSQEDWIDGDTYHLVLKTDLLEAVKEYNSVKESLKPYLSFGSWLIQKEYATEATEEDITVIYDLD